MGSKSKSSKTTTNNTYALTSEQQGNTNVAVAGTGNEITVTDFGAVQEALDTVEDVVNDSLSNTKSILNDQVSAIKQLATDLKNGDILSAQWMGLAIVAAVLIALVVYFVWGK